MADVHPISIPIEIDVSKALPSIEEVNGGIGKLKTALDTLKRSNQDSVIPGFVRDMDEQIGVTYSNVEHLLASRKAIDSSISDKDRSYNLQNFQNAYNRAIRSVLDLANGLEASKNLGSMLSSDVRAIFTASMKPAANQLKAAFNSVAQNLSSAFGNQRQEDIIKTFLGSADLNKVLSTHNLLDKSKGMSKNVMAEYAKAIYSTSVSKLYDQKYVDWDVFNKKTINSVKERLPSSFKKLSLVQNPKRSELSKDSYFLTNTESKQMQEYINAHPFILREAEQAGLVRRHNGTIYWNPGSTRAHVNAFAGNIANMFETGVRGGPSSGIKQINDESLLTVRQRNSILNKHNNYTMNSEHAARFLDSNFKWLQPTYTRNQKGIGFVAPKGSSESNWTNIGRVTGTARQDAMDFYELDLSAIQNGKAVIPNWNEETPYGKRPFIRVNRSMMQNMLSKQKGADQFIHNGLNRNEVYVRLPVDELSDYETTPERMNAIKAQIAGAMKGPVGIAGLGDYVFNGFTGTHMVLSKKSLVDQIKANPETRTFLSNGETSRSFSGENAYEKFAKSLAYQKLLRTEGESVQELWGVNPDDIKVVVANMKEITDSNGKKIMLTGNDGMRIVDSRIFPQSFQHRDFGGKGTSSKWDLTQLRREYANRIATEDHPEEGIHKGDLVFPTGGWDGGKLIIPEGTTILEDATLLKTKSQYAGKSQAEINRMRTEQERKFDILAKTTAEGFQTDVQYISAQEASTLELTDNARDYFRNVGLKMLASLRNPDSLKQLLFSGDDSLSQLVKENESYLTEAPAKERVRDFRAKITNLMRGGNLILPRGTAQYAMAQAWVPDMFNALIEAGGQTPTERQQAMSLQSFKKKNAAYHKQMSVDDTIAYFAQADSDLMQLFRNPSTFEGNILAGNAAIDKYFQDLSTALGIDKDALYADPRSRILERMQTMDFDGDTVFNAALKSNSQFREIMLPVLAATAERYKHIKELSGFTDEEQAERAKRQTSKYIDDTGKTYSLDNPDDLATYAVNLFKRNGMMGLSHSIALGARQFDLSETTARALRDINDQYDVVSNTLFKTNAKFDPTKEEWNVAGKGSPFYRIFEFARKATSSERDENGVKKDIFDYASFARRKIDRLNFSTIFDKNAMLADTENYMFHNLYPEADDANYNWDDIFAHLNELSPIDTSTHAGKFQQAMRDLKRSRAKGEWLVMDEDTQQKMRALGTNAFREISQQVKKEIDSGTFKGNLETEIQKRYNEIGGGALQLELMHGLTAGYFEDESIRSEIDRIVEASGMDTPFANMDYIPEVRTEWEENKNKAEKEANEKRKAADELKAKLQKEEQEKLEQKRKEIAKLKGKDAYRNVLENAISKQEQIEYIQSIWGEDKTAAEKRLSKWQRAYPDVAKKYEPHRDASAIVTMSDKLPPEAQITDKNADFRNEPVKQSNIRKPSKTTEETELQRQYREAEEQAKEAEAAVEAYNNDAALIAEIQRVTAAADEQLKNLRVSRNKNDSAVKESGKAESYFSRQAAITRSTQKEIAAILDPNNTIMQSFFGKNEANLSAQNHLVKANQQLGTELYEDFFSYVQRMGKSSSDSIDELLDKQINKPSKQKQLLDAQKDELEELQKARLMLLNGRDEKGFLPLGSEFNAATPLTKPINIDDNELTTLGDLQQYTLKNIDANIARKKAGIQELKAAIISENESLFESELNDLALKVSPNLAKNSPKVLSAQRLKKINAAKAKLDHYHTEGLYSDDIYADHLNMLSQMEAQSSVEAIESQQADARRLYAQKTDNNYNQLMRSRTMSTLSRYGIDRTHFGRGLASYYNGISRAETEKYNIDALLKEKRTEIAGEKVGSDRYQTLTNEIENLQKASDQAGKDIGKMSGFMGVGNAIAGQMAQSFGRLTSMFGRRIFMRLISEVKQFVKQFNQTLTEIQMITLKTDEQMSTLGDGLIDKAKELKISIQEISTSAATLYRQGLSDEEVNDRLEVISKFSKVSGTKVADATKLITVAMNTGLVTDAQVASDVVTALGDNAATNAQQIEKSIEKAGAAAAADGTTFAELASMLTAITSTTQIGGNVAGRTLNTIFGRMNKIGTNELITDENGNMISGSAVAKLLKKQGIDMYENGKKRSSYDVLYSLSQKWEGMTDAEQQQIANAIAGTRQYSNFAAIMQGMTEGKVDEYMKLAGESTGITDKKFEVYTKSLNASLTDLKNTFDDLINSFADKGYAQDFIEGITTMIEGVKKFVEALGGLQTALPTLMLLLGMFSGAKFGGIGALIGAGIGFGTYHLLTAIGNDAQKQSAAEIYEEHLKYQNERYESTINDVNRYKELKNKNDLTKEEQSELGKLTASLSEYGKIDLTSLGKAADETSSAMDKVTASSKSLATEIEKRAKEEANKRLIQDTYKNIASGVESIVEKGQKGVTSYLQDNLSINTKRELQNFADITNIEYEETPEGIKKVLDSAAKHSNGKKITAPRANSLIDSVSRFLENESKTNTDLEDDYRFKDKNYWKQKILRGELSDDLISFLFKSGEKDNSLAAQKESLKTELENYYEGIGVESKYINAMAEQVIEDYYGDSRITDYVKANGLYPNLKDDISKIVLEDIINKSIGKDENSTYDPEVFKNSYINYSKNKYVASATGKLENWDLNEDYVIDKSKEKGQPGYVLTREQALKKIEEYEESLKPKKVKTTAKNQKYYLQDAEGNTILESDEKSVIDKAFNNAVNRILELQDQLINDGENLINTFGYDTVENSIKSTLKDLGIEYTGTLKEFVESLAENFFTAVEEETEEMVTEEVVEPSEKPQLEEYSNRFVESLTGYSGDKGWYEKNKVAVAADAIVKQLTSGNYTSLDTFQEDVENSSSLMEDWALLAATPEIGRILREDWYNKSTKRWEVPEEKQKEILDQLLTATQGQSLTYGKRNFTVQQRAEYAKQVYDNLSGDNKYFLTEEAKERAQNEAWEEYEKYGRDADLQKAKEQYEQIAPYAYEQEKQRISKITKESYIASREDLNRGVIDPYALEYLKEFIGENLYDKFTTGATLTNLENRFISDSLENGAYGLTDLTTAQKIEQMRLLYSELGNGSFAKTWQANSDVVRKYAGGFSQLNDLANLSQISRNADQEAQYQQLISDFNDYINEENAKYLLSTSLQGASNYATQQYNANNKAALAADEIYKSLPTAAEGLVSFGQSLSKDQVKNWKELLSSSPEINKRLSELGVTFKDNKIDFSAIEDDSAKLAEVFQYLQQTVAEASDSFKNLTKVMSVGETQEAALNFLAGTGDIDEGYEAYREYTGNDKLAQIVRNRRIKYDKQTGDEWDKYNREYDAYVAERDDRYRRFKLLDEQYQTKENLNKLMEGLVEPEKPEFIPYTDADLNEYETRYARQLEQNAGYGISGLTETQRYNYLQELLSATRNHGLSNYRKQDRIGILKDVTQGMEGANQWLAASEILETTFGMTMDDLSTLKEGTDRYNEVEEALSGVYDNLDVATDANENFKQSIAEAGQRIKTTGDYLDSYNIGLRMNSKNLKEANAARKSWNQLIAETMKNQQTRTKFQEGKAKAEDVAALTGYDIDFVKDKKNKNTISDYLSQQEQEDIENLESAANGYLENVNSILHDKFTDQTLEVEFPNVELVGVDGAINFDAMAAIVGEDAAIAMLALAQELAQQGISTHFEETTDEQGAPQIKLVVDKLGKGGGHRGGGGGGKSAADKLLETQKHKMAELEHQNKMLQIDEKTYDYTNNYGAQRGNIQDQINMQYKLKDAYSANIKELEDQLAKTEKDSDDWYKLKDAIYSAEEAMRETTNTINELNNKRINILSDQLEEKDKPVTHRQNMLDKYASLAMSEDRFRDYERFTQERIKAISEQRSGNDAEIARWKKELATFEKDSDSWREVRDKIWALEEENAELDNQLVQSQLDLNSQRLSQIAKVLQQNTQTANHNLNIASTYSNVYQSGGYRSEYEAMIKEQQKANNDLIAENMKAEESARAQMSTLEEGSTAWFEAQAAVYQYQEAIAQTNATQLELNRTLAESDLESVAENYTDATRELNHVNDMLSTQAQEYLNNNDYEAYFAAMNRYLENIPDIIEAEQTALNTLRSQYESGMKNGTLDPTMQRQYLDEINNRESELQKLIIDQQQKQKDMNKVQLDKILEDQDFAASEHDHNIKLLGYETSKYQNNGELTNVNRMIEKENSLRESRTEALKAEIEQLKIEQKLFDDGSDEEQRVVEQIKRREEALEAENVQIDKNNKLLVENEKKIMQVRKTLEDAVDKEIEAEKKRQREILSANVNMEETIVNLIKKRLQDEWDLEKKNIERQKEALNEYKKLINERFNYRKKASQQADKDEELADYRRQLALVEADPSRTKDAKELRRKISELEKDQSWQLAEGEVEAESERIDNQMEGMDKFVQYNEELLNEILGDANNFAVEMNEILSGSFEDSYNKIMEFMSKENEAFMNSLPDAQKQMIQGWEDTWKKANDIVDSNYMMITSILTSKDSFMDYMKNTNRDYRSYMENGDQNSMSLLERQWGEYYDNYVNSTKDSANFDAHAHSIGDVVSSIDELSQEEFKVNIVGIDGKAPSAYGLGGSGTDTIDFSNGQGLTLEDLNSIYKVVQPVVKAVQTTKTSNKSGSNGPKSTGKALDSEDDYRGRGKPIEEDTKAVTPNNSGNGITITSVVATMIEQLEDAYSEIVKPAKINNAIENNERIKLPYANGGLVDFTGPTWVDGTKSRPESFLDATDTSLLRSMLDTFSTVKTRPYMSYIDPSLTSNNSTVGDINITINQAELKSDADYDKVAQRVGQAFTKELKRNGLNLAGYAF